VYLDIKRFVHSHNEDKKFPSYNIIEHMRHSLHNKLLMQKSTSHTELTITHNNGYNVFTPKCWGTLCHSCTSLGWIEHDHRQLTLIAREVAELGNLVDIVCRSRRSLLRMVCRMDQLLVHVTGYIHISLKILKNTLESNLSMHISLHISKI